MACYKFLVKLLFQEYLLQNSSQIGGMYIDENGMMQPEEVEIDDSVIAKAKYHRGRWPQTRWIFGGVER